MAVIMKGTVAMRIRMDVGHDVVEMRVEVRMTVVMMDAVVAVSMVAVSMVTVAVVGRPFPDVVVTVSMTVSMPVPMTVPVSMSVATIQGEMSQAIQLHGRLSDGGVSSSLMVSDVESVRVSVVESVMPSRTSRFP